MITHNKFAKSTSALIAAFLLAAIFAVCGSSESDEAIPYARVDSTSRIFEISDFENAGFKVVKKYDIEGLTGATAAMHGFQKNVGADPLSCELRFYNSHDEAVKLGQSLAVKVTGGGATNTHRVWQQGSGKELWSIEPDDLKGRMPEFLPDVHEIREDFADYLGECQAVDAGLGVLIAKLEEIGELDNTIIAVSGDHGIPGFPRAKCSLYQFGTEVSMAVRWPKAITAGRTVDDFVNLMDIAPTFLDAAGVDLPEGMTGHSLLPLLKSEGSGQIEPQRDFVVTGRERQNLVDNPRPDEGLPYPTSAIRTKDFLYIHNFEPDRWPAGDPMGLDDPTAEPPPPDELLNSYTGVYPDLDKSPTKS
ncbi:MAG: sulfatase-like hydrolase/transferase [Chloroflexi bacterium]|nr:sulfatase-like hydrolase/transferase [Chloroflexota bacterium]